MTGSFDSQVGVGGCITSSTGKALVSVRNVEMRVTEPRPNDNTDLIASLILDDIHDSTRSRV